MSTKIGHGLIATDSDPFEAARRMRAVLVPMFLELFEPYARELAALPKDAPVPDHWGLKEPLLRGYLPVDTTLKAMEKLHRSTTWTFSDADIFYEVSLLQNITGGPPLVFVFGEKSRLYREALIEAGVLKSYGYWDNSDPDEDVSQEEWDERKQAWSILDDATPSEIQLGFSVPSALELSVQLGL